MKLSVQEAAVRVLGAAISVLLVCPVLQRRRAVPRALPLRRARRTATSSKPNSTDAAAKAVTDAGGQVDSRLNIIDAVEAKLTDAQRARVLAATGIKQVTPNAQVTTQAAASVRDNFENGSFANNDGTHRWYGDWVEQNDDNNPHGGKVTIGWNDRGGRRLIVSSNGAIYRRAATPASSATVTLKFKYARAGLDYGDYVSVQASGNGGTTWTELGRLNGPANDMTFINQSYNITSYRGRDTAIRFVGNMGGRFGQDNVDIDDVEITYTTTFSEGDPFPVDVNARDLHTAGIKGGGIGVAVIDTGFWKLDSLDKDSLGNGRVDAQFDAVRNALDTQYSSIVHRYQRPRHACHQPDCQQPQGRERPLLRRGAGCAPGFGQGFRRGRFEQLCHGDPRHRLGAHQPHELQHSSSEFVARGPGAFALLGRSAQ